MERDVFQAGKAVKVPWWAWVGWGMSPPRRFDAGGGIEGSRGRGKGESSAKEYKAEQSGEGPGGAKAASLEGEPTWETKTGSAVKEGSKRVVGESVLKSEGPGRGGQGGLDGAGSEARYGADGLLGMLVWEEDDGVTQDWRTGRERFWFGSVGL